LRLAAALTLPPQQSKATLLLLPLNALLDDPVFISSKKEKVECLTMGNIMGKDKPLKEVMRENKRMINRAVRELDREKVGLEREEQRITIEIKKAARENQMGAVRTMAKDLVRTRQHIAKFIEMRRCAPHQTTNRIVCVVPQRRRRAAVVAPRRLWHRLTFMSLFVSVRFVSFECC
jgi:Snf7